MNQKSFFSFFAIVLLICSCSRDKYVTFSGYAQGGTYQVKANLKGVTVSKKSIAADIDSLLNEIDFSISGYNKNSLLSKRNAGEEIIPDRHFEALCTLSEKYRQLSNGAFDVNAGPLFDIWGFGFKNDSLPSPERIAAAMKDTQEKKVLNFNAIAQGYSCDVIASYLKELGVEDMLVDIGEIYCSGVNAEGKGWSIGIDTPTDGNNTPGESLSGIWQSEGQACGVVTSGNYRKFYIKDGKKYAHTIDPRSGYPVDHSLLSATVIAPSAAEADALATICMVLGPEEAKDLIESLENVEAYFIMSEGSWRSSAFKLK